MVEAATGFRPKLVRVPYGAFKGQVPGLVSYPMIQWNIDTQDWSSKDKDAIAASVLSPGQGWKHHTDARPLFRYG